MGDDGEDEFSDDDESVISTSSRYSRDGTPALRDELKYLRSATPLREMASETGWFYVSLPCDFLLLIYFGIIFLIFLILLFSQVLQIG